tara:strand:+ start:78 stop:389 length:312 start_codon:yes stop_codon:yes gene_type:complete
MLLYGIMPRTLTKAPDTFRQTKPLYRPYISTNPKKKGMVFVMKGSGKRLIHFGDASMKDFRQHKDPARRKNYLERSGGIRNKSGELTKNDKNSANYYSRKYLW